MANLLSTFDGPEIFEAQKGEQSEALAALLPPAVLSSHQCLPSLG